MTEVSNKTKKLWRSRIRNKAGSRAGSEKMGYGTSHSYSRKSSSPAPAPKPSKKTDDRRR